MDDIRYERGIIKRGNYRTKTILWTWDRTMWQYISFVFYIQFVKVLCYWFTECQNDFQS
jgi:hypothetical protein